MRRGFTLIELIIIMGVVAILMMIVLPNMGAPIRKSAFSETLSLLVSDTKAQQQKAMLGDAKLVTGPKAYGINFTSTDYTLFQGPSFLPGDANNFTVELDPNLNFSFINLPQTQIIFAPGSGDATNFINNSYTLTLIDLETGRSSIITFNRHGIIEQVL